MGKGYTQQELAVKINRTRPLVSHIERTGKGNHYTLRSICDVLDIPLDVLENDMAEEANLPHADLSELALLKTENRLLRQEIVTLRELVASQKHFIGLITETLSG